MFEKNTGKKSQVHAFSTGRTFGMRYYPANFSDKIGKVRDEGQAAVRRVALTGEEHEKMTFNKYRQEPIVVMAAVFPPPELQQPLPPAPAPQQRFPSLATQAANVFESAVAFVGDGFGVVDDAEFRRRLEICRACDRRTGKRCTACGCWIGVKARGRAFHCPIGRWE